jgi:ABC-type arginine transport system ATPase subunit
MSLYSNQNLRTIFFSCPTYLDDPEVTNQINSVLLGLQDTEWVQDIKISSAVDRVDVLLLVRKEMTRSKTEDQNRESNQGEIMI